MYYEGQGTVKNYEKALEWFLKGANQGNAYLQYRVGEMYYEGQGTVKNYKKALEWFQKAADQGYEDAQSKLAYLQ